MATGSSRLCATVEKKIPQVTHLVRASSFMVPLRMAETRKGHVGFRELLRVEYTLIASSKSIHSFPRFLVSTRGYYVYLLSAKLSCNFAVVRVENAVVSALRALPAASRGRRDRGFSRPSGQVGDHVASDEMGRDIARC